MDRLTPFSATTPGKRYVSRSTEMIALMNWNRDYGSPRLLRRGGSAGLI